MKDNLILERKIYISARRAAEITGYTSDYVGQLCRGGKLDSKMVGRSWFVLEESIISHRALNAKVPPEKIPSVISTSLGEDVLALAVSASRNEKPKELESSVLAYEKENAPLIPELKKKVESTFGSVVFPMIEVSKRSMNTPVFSTHVGQVSFNQSVLQNKKISHSPISFHRLNSSTFWPIVFIAFFVVSSVFFMQTFLSSSNFFKEPSLLTSSSFESVRALFQNLQEIKNSAFAFISGKDIKNSSVPPVDDSSTAPSSSGGLNGMAVIPSSNLASQDEIAKKGIKNSFSDEVKVSPDESGTAGVITPVFREATSSDFIYVLVPVSEKKK